MKRSARSTIVLSVFMAGTVGLMSACDSPKPSGLKGRSQDQVPADCDEEESEKAAGLKLASDQDAAYNGMVKTVLNGKCATAGCHVAGAQAPDLSTFAGASGAGARIIARSVTASTMPPAGAATGALDATQKDILQTWATKGFPENAAVAPTKPADPAQPADPAAVQAAAKIPYSDIAALMTATACTGCHSAASKLGNTVLDNQTDYDLKAVAVAIKMKTPHSGQTYDSTQLQLVTDYAAIVGYGAVSTLVKDSGCTGCHGGAAPQGGVTLDTEAGYVSVASNVVTTMSNPDGHMGKKFDAAQLKLVTDFDTVLKAKSADKPAEKAPEEETAKSEEKDECVVPTSPDDGGGEGTPIADSKFKDILKPAKLAECNDEKDLLYDRRTKDCHAASFGASFDCSWEGVKATFGTAKGGDKLAELEGDKWQVDQCGTLDGDPVVFLIKPEVVDGLLNLGIKLLGVE